MLSWDEKEGSRKLPAGTGQGPGKAGRQRACKWQLKQAGTSRGPVADSDLTPGPPNPPAHGRGKRV